MDAQKTTATDILGGIAGVLGGEAKPTVKVETEIVLERESILSLGLMLLIVFTILIILWAIARRLSRAQ